jgi:HTH-type transcriptional regulator, competence development regulator
MNILGKRLKHLREKFNYSQKRVADSTGISNVQLSRYESGDRNPDPELISKFADYYGVTTDYLHGRTDDPHGFATEKDDTYDSLAEITKIVKDLGLEQFGFFDIEKWKNLSQEDVNDIKKHFEWVAQKAKERNEEKK